MTLRVLDLFSGIGGFSLGLERAGMETVAFCEIEPYARRVLAKHWPEIPIHDDVRALDGSQYRGTVDLICGGYPCQPFSLAGKRRGQEDDRHLWPEVYRLLQETGARWFVGENVFGHITMGLDDVLSDLERAGYSARTFVIPAVALDAIHRRDRVWIVAHTECDSIQGGAIIPAEGSELLEPREKQLAGFQFSGATASLPSARAFGSRYGVSGRVDSVGRNRALGNAVVPQIPEMIGRAIMAVEGF